MVRDRTPLEWVRYYLKNKLNGGSTEDIARRVPPRLTHLIAISQYEKLLPNLIVPPGASRAMYEEALEDKRRWLLGKMTDDELKGKYLRRCNILPIDHTHKALLLLQGLSSPSERESIWQNNQDFIEIFGGTTQIRLWTYHFSLWLLYEEETPERLWGGNIPLLIHRGY